MHRSVKEETVLLSQQISAPASYHEAIASLTLDGSTEGKHSFETERDAMKRVPRKIIR